MDNSQKSRVVPPKDESKADEYNNSIVSDTIEG